MLRPDKGCHTIQVLHPQAQYQIGHRHRSPCQPPPAAWHPPWRRGRAPWWTGTSRRAGPASRGGQAATPEATLEATLEAWQPRHPWQQAPAAHFPRRTGETTSSGPAAACPWCLAARSPSQVRGGLGFRDLGFRGAPGAAPALQLVRPALQLVRLGSAACVEAGCILQHAGGGREVSGERQRAHPCLC